MVSVRLTPIFVTDQAASKCAIAPAEVGMVGIVGDPGAIGEEIAEIGLRPSVDDPLGHQVEVGVTPN